MEVSPLTLQTRPETFQPKITLLYESLFKDEEEVPKSEGFWEEFFLLKPDAASLTKILAGLTAEDLLHFQAHPQQLVLRSLNRAKSGKAPGDENALETLTVFLASILRKRYTNPSSDIISILAGLHDADAVFSDLVATLETIIRSGRSALRQRAVYTALALTAGAYATGIVSYFTHRDLFPSLMKFVQDSEDHKKNFEPFVLLGLLANYNKFEFQNPYKIRLDDFVNENIIQKIIYSIGATCSTARDQYVAVQDDIPESWSLASTLSLVGLGSLAPGKKPAVVVLSPEEEKARFTALPGPEATVLLPTYDFATANKLFSFNFVTLHNESRSQETPLGAFLSLASYLFQHAHRALRGAQYAYLSLFTIQTLVEDPVLVKRICSQESKSNVRLCRQRQPYLPLVRGDRVLATVLLDMMIDAINHNLRRRIDVEFYISCLGILLRLISFLGRSKTRLVYHWSELWRSLLSFIKFLASYPTDIKVISKAPVMLNILVNLNGLALSTGESFLPDAAAYDDLFYKLVEAGDILIKFRDIYEVELVNPKTGAIDSLISVSRHYHSLLEENDKSRARSKHISSQQVQKIIQQGYETLSIQAREGLDHWEKFREADEKTILKRSARIAIDDIKEFIAGEK